MNINFTLYHLKRQQNFIKIRQDRVTTDKSLLKSIRKEIIFRLTIPITWLSFLLAFINSSENFTFYNSFLLP
jgi:hypothetical protein